MIEQLPRLKHIDGDPELTEALSRLELPSLEHRLACLGAERRICPQEPP